jgi:Ni/Co efflux regulator RcnB
MTRWPMILAALALASAAASVPLGSPSAAYAQMRHHWQRGETLPPDVLQAGPNVNYAAQRLRRPPEGYGWFTLDGAFLLASLSNGLIVDVAD